MCCCTCVHVEGIAVYINVCFRMLPREVDPLVYNMSHEDPGNISYGQIGGLSEQIRELREVCIVVIFAVLKYLPCLYCCTKMIAF